MANSNARRRTSSGPVTKTAAAANPAAPYPHRQIPQVEAFRYARLASVRETIAAKQQALQAESSLLQQRDRALLDEQVAFLRRNGLGGLPVGGFTLEESDGLLPGTVLDTRGAPLSTKAVAAQPIAEPVPAPTPDPAAAAEKPATP